MARLERQQDEEFAHAEVKEAVYGRQPYVLSQGFVLFETNRFAKDLKRDETDSPSVAGTHGPRGLAGGIGDRLRP